MEDFKNHYGMASSTTPGMMSTGTQTIAGNKNFTDRLGANVSPLAPLHIKGEGTSTYDQGFLLENSAGNRFFAFLPGSSMGVGTGTTVGGLTDTGIVFESTGAFRAASYKISGTAIVDTDGNFIPLGYMKLKSYTVGTLPSAVTSGAGASVYVTDAATAACAAISNGTNWKRGDAAATTVS